MELQCKNEHVMLAKALNTRSYNSTFGRGDSTLGRLETFRWNREKSSFELGSNGDLLMGCWQWKAHPCTKEIAVELLLLCASLNVQDRFSEPYVTDHDYYVVNDCMLGLEVSGARGMCGGSIRQNALTISYYHSHCLENIKLSSGLTAHFWRLMQGLRRREIVARLG